MKLIIFLTLSSIFLQIFCVFGYSSAPVFIWGKIKSSKVSALKHYSENEFLHFLNDEIPKDAFTLVFVENKILLEEIGNCKTYDSITCFKNIEKSSFKSYFPHVENAVNALQSFANVETIDFMNPDYDRRIVPENGKVTFVYLDDSNDRRSNILSAHDSLIAEFEEQVNKQHNNAVFIYTAYSAQVSVPFARSIRQVKQDETNVTGQLFSDNSTYLLYLEEIAFKEATAEEPTVVHMTNSVVVNSTATGFVIELSGTGHNNVLSLSLYTEAEAWEVSKIVFNNKEYFLNTYIGTFLSFSFHCSPQSQFISKDGLNTLLLITGLQLQPRFGNNTDGFSSFDDAWDCVGFTSPGIWGGLFVTILMLLILTVGISMMLDIRTMDKFDDVKGKTITVNVSE